MGQSQQSDDQTGCEYVTNLCLRHCDQQSRARTLVWRRQRPRLRCAGDWPASCGRPTAPCSAGWPRWARSSPRLTRSSCVSALTRSTWPRRGRKWLRGRGHWADRWTWLSWWSLRWGSSWTPRRTSWNDERGEQATGLNDDLMSESSTREDRCMQPYRVQSRVKSD